MDVDLGNKTFDNSAKAFACAGKDLFHCHFSDYYCDHTRLLHVVVDNFARDVHSLIDERQLHFQRSCSSWEAQERGEEEGIHEQERIGSCDSVEGRDSSEGGEAQSEQDLAEAQEGEGDSEDGIQRSQSICSEEGEEEHGESPETITVPATKSYRKRPLRTQNISRALDARSKGLRLGRRTRLTQEPILLQESRSAHIHDQQPSSAGLPRRAHDVHTIFHPLVDEIDVEDAKLMNRLLWMIACPKSIEQLRDVCILSRKRAMCTPPTVTNPMLALCYLDTSDHENSLLRRYHLVRLVEWRNSLVKAATDHKLRPTRKKRKRDFVVQRGTGRPDVTALHSIMAESFPGIGKEDKFYKEKHRKLRARLSSGQNWMALKERLSIDVLALIPGYLGVQNSW